MSQLTQADQFMLIDYKRVLAEETPEAVAECGWLLVTASRLVEREALLRIGERPLHRL